MMKKITFLIIFSLLLGFNLSAQVTVGNGTGNSSALPITSCYGYSYTQQVYYASELYNSGTITTISFHLDSATSTTDFSDSTDWTVYLGHSSRTLFASNTDWEPLANLTPVYTGIVTFPTEDNWFQITLDTPFAYNGTDNLIVAVHEYNSGYDCSMYWTKTDDPVYRGISYRNDSTNPDPASPPTASATHSFFPNAIFGGLPAPTDTPDWANMQWLSEPTAGGSNTSLTVDAWTTVTGYAQVYESGVTDAAGQGAGIECWIGGNNENTDPSTWPSDSWNVATFHGDAGNNDEYKIEKVMDFSGTVYVAARWRLNGGPFVYGAYNGPWDGTTNNNIELVVNPVVANDNCDGAIALTVNSDFACGTVTAGTLLQATESMEDDSACSGTENDDVWFSFVASNATHRISLTNVAGSPTDLYHSLWEGTCGSLSLVSGSCSDSDTSNPSGLVSGNTYYVRVNSYSSNSGATSTFDICIGTPPPPPANDACATATNITSLPYNDTLDASFATNNDGFISDCTSTSGMNDGVWFTFEVATAGDVTVLISNVSGWDPEVAVYSGTCGSFTCVTSDDSGGPSVNETVTFSGVAGTRYYVNVGDYSGFTNYNEGPFMIDVTGTAVLGIANATISGFQMFPNPVANTLNLRAQNNIDTVSIYNMLGQEVLRNTPTSTQVEMDMSHLPTGSYVLKVQAGNQIGSYNLIKQ